MNRQGNKVFIIYYHRFTEHRNIICYLPGQTAALAVPLCHERPVLCLKCFCLPPWNYLSTQPVYPSLPSQPSSKYPLPNLLYPLTPHPCSHSLPSSYTVTSQIDLAISYPTQHCCISFVTCLVFFHHSRKIGNQRKLKVCYHCTSLRETAIIRLWHIASTFLRMCYIIIFYIHRYCCPDFSFSIIL